MKHEKPLSENSWMTCELQALRSETPTADGLSQAVRTMQSTPTAMRVPRPRTMWRAAAVAAGACGFTAVLVVSMSSADASELKKIAAAMRAQHNRHDRGFRPDKNGNWIITNENWVEGVKQSEAMYDAEGNKSIILFDGHRSYISYPHNEAIVDDTQPSSIPIEDVSAYLNIPGCKLVSHTHGDIDVYTLDFSNMGFKLYVNPVTQLPIRREVVDKRGNVFERNEYDYPADVDDAVFTIPTSEANVTDYPKIRRQLAERLGSPGQTQQVGGVTVSLKAVLVGKHRVIALFTGGSKGGLDPEGKMEIEGAEAASVSGRPEAFGLPLSSDAPPATPSPFMAGNPDLRGDGLWVESSTYGKALKISVPIWVEDPTKPLMKHGRHVGYYTKVGGRASFVVRDTIHAADPDRVLWRPSGDSVNTAKGE